MQPLAFVDLETTGVSSSKDRITEIGIVLVDEKGVQEWSQLLHPQMRIPLYIEQLTGISNDMVAKSPVFEEVADKIWTLLSGRLFIAHNARFDYGFLKNEFKRTGRTFQPPVLCTVKLSRKLFPQYHHHNLDSLIQRHQLQADGRHRALADAQLIHQFWRQLSDRFPQQYITDAVQVLINRSSLPSHLDPAIVDELPKSAGVYFFYGENDLPLYIGKSVNIRQRVLSHFSADHTRSKEMRLSQQTRRIDWLETGGELGALLTEARLIKQIMPVYNQRLRRKNELCAWQLLPCSGADVLKLVWANELDFGRQDNLYGLYHSRRDAQKALRNLAEKHQLCLKGLGLEKGSGQKSCFAYQLKRCKGVCVGEETVERHNLRLLVALSKMKLASWPYKGAIGIREQNDIHVIDHWCYLGTAQTEADIYELLNTGQPVFDKDTYTTLKKALKTAEVIELPKKLR